MSNADINVQQVRAKAKELADRVQSDPAFRSAVESDPNGALTAAGLPARAVEEFVIDVGITPDVAGYKQMECTDTCWIITCLVTHA